MKLRLNEREGRNKVEERVSSAGVSGDGALGHLEMIIIS